MSTAEELLQREDWTRRSQSLYQLLRSDSLILQISGSISEANVFEQLHSLNDSSAAGKNQRRVRVIMRCWESASTDGYIIIVDESVTDLPAYDATDYEYLTWAMGQPNGVRWLPFDVKSGALSSGSGSSVRSEEYYVWTRTAQTSRDPVGEVHEVIFAIVEGRPDEIAVMPIGAWRAVRSRCYDVEPLLARAPPHFKGFMVNSEHLPEAVARLANAAKNPGQWYRNPTTRVLLKGWVPGTTDKPRVCVDRGSLAPQHSASDIITMIDEIHEAQTKYHGTLCSMAPNIHDFGLQPGDDSPARVEGKMMAVVKSSTKPAAASTAATAATASSTTGHNIERTSFLAAYRLWHTVLARHKSSTGLRIFCMTRDEVTPTMTADLQLDEAFVRDHTFTSWKEVFKHLERHLGDARAAADAALQNVQPEDACRGLRKLLLQPEAAGDPLQSRTNTPLGLPWLPRMLNTFFAATRFGVLIALGHGHALGTHAVIAHRWSDADCEAWAERGDLPRLAWQVADDERDNRCVILRLQTHVGGRSRKPLADPYVVFREQWKKPVKGKGSKFFIVGSILDSTLHRSETARCSQYLFLPSDVTNLSAQEDTLSPAPDAARAKGYHMARRVTADDAMMKKPAFGTTADCVKFSNKKTRFVRADADITIERYIIDVGDIAKNLQAALRDGGQMRVHNPRLSMPNRSFDAGEFIISLTEIMQAEWDYGYELQIANVRSTAQQTVEPDPSAGGE